MQFDYLVSMGCGDACPYVPTKNRIEWDIPDPRDMEPEDFRVVRDQIERQVKDLLAEISADE